MNQKTLGPTLFYISYANMVIMPVFYPVLRTPHHDLFASLLRKHTCAHGQEEYNKALNRNGWSQFCTNCIYLQGRPFIVIPNHKYQSLRLIHAPALPSPTTRLLIAYETNKDFIFFKNQYLFKYRLGGHPTQPDGYGLAGAGHCGDFWAKST